MDQKTSEHALIIGGGIGGLTAALALARRGRPVTVFEQAPAFAEVGAGITISPSAFRGLASLGVGERVADIAEPVENAAFLHYQTGEPLFLDGGRKSDAALPEEGIGRHIHRADLHAILLDAVRAEPSAKVVNGKKLTEVQADDDGVRLRFSDNKTVAGDFLVGCDGLRSATRGALFGAEAPRFTGQVAWRFLAPMEAVKPHLKGRYSSVHVGPGAIFVVYPIRHGAVANCVAIARTDNWKSEGWMHSADRSELEEIYKDWAQEVREIIALTPEDEFFKWALFDRDPLSLWSTERTTLLGDAAHPMLPFMGLGGAMAIEDAVVLARALDEAPDLSTGLALYQQARLARTTTVLEASRRQGALFQDGNLDGYGDAKPPIHDAAFFTYDPATVAL